jgi:hypothetical protein
MVAQPAFRSDLQHISSPSPTPYWLLVNFNYQNFFDEAIHRISLVSQSGHIPVVI